MRESLYLLLAAVLAAASAGGHAQSGWKPEKAIEIVVGSGSGTGTDRTARLIQGIWQEHKEILTDLGLARAPSAQ